MKYQQKLLKFLVAGWVGAIAAPAFAQSFPATNQVNQVQPVNSIQSGFRCDTSGDLPTTLYQNSQGAAEPWIKWQSDHFSGSGWSPEARCQEVSSRLETYRKNRKLKYVTLGTINNQSVICVASQEGGKCEGIIYTLKPGQDGLKSLNNLFAWRKGEQGLESNYESVMTIPYIDVGSRLYETNSAPVAPVAPVEQSTNSESIPDTHREL